MKGSSLYGKVGTFGSLDVMSWGFMSFGVNGLYFVRRRRDIWVTGCNVGGFRYVGVNGLYFVLRRRDIMVTGCNDVGF